MKKKTKEKKIIDTIKKIAKYVVNFLNMINFAIVELSPIWGWELNSVIKTITIIAGIISIYLVGGKLFDLKNNEVNVK